MNTEQSYSLYSKLTEVIAEIIQILGSVYTQITAFS